MQIVEDGIPGEMEVIFATRIQAEQFIYLLPYLMSVGDWTQVRSAIISPLEIV